jgi:peptide deformylase
MFFPHLNSQVLMLYNLCIHHGMERKMILERMIASRNLCLLHMSLRHLQLPGNILRMPAAEVSLKDLGDDIVKEIVSALFYNMYLEEGIGLAAPMAGLGLRIILADEGKGSPAVLVNPQILSLSKTMIEMREANLCLPGITAQVLRPEAITYKAYTPLGQPIQGNASGLFARIIMHEMDILSGRMFCDFVASENIRSFSPDILAKDAIKQIFRSRPLKESSAEGGFAMHHFSPVTLSPKLLSLKATVLRQKANPINFSEWNPEDLRELIEEMFWLQHQLEGVGLAAPQVGLSLRLAVIDDQKDPPLVLINPTITKFSEEMQDSDEGCLSLPGYRGTIKRAKHVTLHSWNPLGEPLELSAEGYLATIIQHEVDHLNGVIYADHLESLTELRKLDPDTLAMRATNEIYKSNQ